MTELHVPGYFSWVLAPVPLKGVHDTPVMNGLQNTGINFNALEYRKKAFNVHTMKIPFQTNVVFIQKGLVELLVIYFNTDLL